jgi:OFA family oxalate/formate antiporter-like MFS transporter
MPVKPSRSYALIACSCGIFWPGSFIYGFPGILRQHWQQAFEADGGAVGGTVFFILAGATCFMYLCGRWQAHFGPGRLAFNPGLLLASRGQVYERWSRQRRCMKDRRGNTRNVNKIKNLLVIIVQDCP